MNKIKITPASFNSLKRNLSGAKVQRVWAKDFQGLGVDLGKTKKSLIYRYKSPETGKFRIMTLDSFTYSQKLDAGLIEDVLITYYKARNQIRADFDPLSQKDVIRTERREVAAEAKRQKTQASEQAEEDYYTFARAYDDYCKEDAYTVDIAEGTQASYASCYNKFIHEAIGHIPLKQLKRMDIKRLVDGLPLSRKSIALNVIRLVQTVAIDNEIIETPFCFNIKAKKSLPRSRLIADLPAFLKWLHTDGDHQTYRNSILAQLLYGTRISELNGLLWSEVDYDKQIINVSWERVKTRRVSGADRSPLELPLMPMMLDILEHQKGYSDTFVFPLMSKDKPMTNSVVKWLLRKEGFNHSSHDSRRTAATLLRGELDCSIDEIDTVLDHSLGAVNKSYVHSSGVNIKRRVLSKWHTYLSGLVNPSITTLKAVNHG